MNYGEVKDVVREHFGRIGWPSPMLDIALGSARREIEKNVVLLVDDTKERVDFPWYHSPFIGTSPNHYSQWASILHFAGILFQIDEKAYGILRDYLQAVNNRFRHVRGGVETVEDIESRIAEIFESQKGTAGTISVNNVEAMISIIGKPEDFDNNDLDDFWAKHCKLSQSDVLSISVIPKPYEDVNDAYLIYKVLEKQNPLN